MNEKNCCGGANQEQFRELDLVLDKYAKVPGSLITILQQTQDIYGYLSVEAINHISEATGIKPAKIYGVATFYAQFRLQPVGKYLIMLCKGTACHVNGADHIEEAVSEYLNIKDGETTEDGLFTLNNVACLGCCSLAPVMMIRSSEGDETYGNLTKDKVQQILGEIRERA
ncbi:MULTISPECIES: NADH-quinone oxidoreductase subunit NuoE [Hornefia]|jgi:NADH-quinone oxidoreductase subunit E|uniref:NADH dehydrogenase n=2 Tax=Hornefia TaxID=2815774 RepID=A0A1Q9JFX4_9FIRM|nr:MULTISPECIES: NADH-quinone oxidoreductase subunit NuoE [Hornefia]MCI7327888.1 NADH-quinone oxidoreductase subunit NuoE [Clostridiales bacterium]MCI7413678.1 NADH-quinone oxidoreductase subunit NuoE [Clostridiales bacterium]MCI7680348.1 NADH-quinone oxidoreductase subunit NuoE [Clostridiales bacterium]MDD6299266.1 NADH-quinone oxidoreductase subunit NuoE [Hornefia butyriciproducens]MDD7020236.1 NADH-quinone oxidoreductase subunit NuoE [Hornefia butyriciproducens]